MSQTSPQDLVKQASTSQDTQVASKKGKHRQKQLQEKADKHTDPAATSSHPESSEAANAGSSGNSNKSSNAASAAAAASGSAAAAESSSAQSIPPDDSLERLEQLIPKLEDERIALSADAKKHRTLADEDRQLLEQLEKSAAGALAEIKKLDEEIIGLQKEIDALSAEQSAVLEQAAQSKRAAASGGTNSRAAAAAAAKPRYHQSSGFNSLLLFLMFLITLVLFGLLVGIDEVSITRRFFRLLLGRPHLGGLSQRPS